MSSLSKKKKIAITGLIGSGKSSVLAYLKEKGYGVFSADEYVSYLYQHDIDLIEQIENMSPVSIVVNHQIDKTKLKEIFFEDPLLKLKVEELVHKKVYEAIFNDKMEAIFYEVPLLFETEKEDLFDEVILVVTSRKKQFERLKKERNMSDQQIEKRLNNQMAVSLKLTKSDVLLMNETTLNHLYYQIDAYLKRREDDFREN